MTIDNIEVRTNSFKKSPARKKDGLHQIKIRVFIGKLEFGKFRNQKTLEIKVLDDAESGLMIRASDFDNIDKNKPQQFHILKAELLAKDAVKQMVSSNIELTSKNLFDFINQSSKAAKPQEFKRTSGDIRIPVFRATPSVSSSIFEPLLLAISMILQQFLIKIEDRCRI
jgi:hypothetical protein